MFTRWLLVQRSLLHHWRSNLAIALGVAVATAVLSGALMVGDSMRGSLRNLTLDRLGKIDQLLVSDGFFRQQLADEVEQLEVVKEHYGRVTPAILFPGGTVENEAGKGRASNVTIIGATIDFPSFDLVNKWAVDVFTGQQVAVNQALADDLGITAAEIAAGTATVTLRIPKRGQLPSDSSLGKKDDLIESLVNLKVGIIMPTTGLGRFSLHPSQADPLNIYVPIELLQDALSRTVLKHKSSSTQANVLLLSSADGNLVSEQATAKLRDMLRPALEDFGLLLKRAKLTFGDDDNKQTIYDYWSVSSDRLVMSPEVVDALITAFSTAKPVFTYLANDLQVAARADKPGIPFSMVASIDFDSSFQPRSAVTGELIQQPEENEIVLNQWAAKDIDAKIGDSIEVTYFEPESRGGQQVERATTFVLSDIARLVEPLEAPAVRRRGRIEPAVYDQSPAVANDMDLTPEVPGLTDAASIENWDLPFETADKIRSQDDDYWTLHRTTPKAFVSLAAGQKLWNSRFGQVTSFRIPVAAGDETEIARRLSSQLARADSDLGLRLVSIKRRGLAASSGSTPFDALFLALSIFVVASALILVALLFRLALQQRSAELGLMSAVGIAAALVRRIFLTEMVCVAALGAWLGVQLGVGYAALMIHGLTTWWVGAISRPFLRLQINATSLVIGLLIGILICAVTIWWSLRSIRKQNVVGLLRGQIDADRAASGGQSLGRWLVWTQLVAAVGLSALAATLSGEPQAGAFMAAGFLVLSALLLFVFQLLRRAGSDARRSAMRLRSIGDVASRAASRNPLRSTLTIGLVAVASFLIVAVSSFRLSPNDSGTAGFDWIATSSQAIIDPVEVADAGSQVFSIRHQNGEDASCNNLYQSTQPQVLGVPQAFIDSFDGAYHHPSGHHGENAGTPFAWGGTIAEEGKPVGNPWHLLDAKHAGTEDDPIPVIIDKNTANYSLKIYFPKTQFSVEYDSGESVHFVAVGFLANTILQGALITSEENFLSAFPDTAGYRYFLIRDSADSKVAANLEEQFQDYGFDARSADTTLAGFMSVQNTYLSTFQSLGGLGLLLGTFGLAAVQIRSVMERRRELALMQAVGFGRAQLARMILLESVWLLLAGLGIGLAAALFSTLPHWLIGSASIPWLELAIIFVVILITGLLASGLASRTVARMPLLTSLRG